MNDIDDDAPDELTLRYRRASAGDPSRPSLQTRAAIAAQARTVMTYRTTRAADEASLARMEASPAANDSRWKLRAVAGLAGVGLAGLLAMQAIRNTPGPELPRATVFAEATLERQATEQDATSSKEERESAAASAESRPSAPATVAIPSTEKRSVGRSQPAPIAFSGGGMEPNEQSVRARGNAENLAESTASPSRMAPMAIDSSKPVANDARASTQVNSAVRAYFSGGLPISRPQMNVALFTVFMNGSGAIVRSRLEYVVGEGLSRLSQTAATTDRFVALGVARNQIGQMGTSLISDEADLVVGALFNDGDPAVLIEELKRYRADLSLRFTPKHPDMVAVDSALQRMKEAQEDSLCCRLVMVVYALPRVE